MSEWFIQKRGLANGVIFAGINTIEHYIPTTNPSTGTAAGGLILPLILPKVLTAHGPSSTLRYLSIAIGSLLIPLLPFAKGRLPQSRVHGPRARSTDRAWLKSRSFWFLMMVNTVQSFGYFVPILWLPSRLSCTFFSIN